ncbi:MAG: hypothetical protein ACYTFO_02680 [Planctomycetota bacterium]|jgi:hypothetical protein
MKAERRHELQHNALDTELGQIIRWVRKHGTAILWAIALTALAATLVTYLVNRAGAEERRLWALYQQAASAADPTLTTPDRLAMLAEVADQDTDRELAAMAAMRMADLHMNEPYVQMGPGPGESWTKAQAGYERVINDFADQPKQVALAHVGLAALAENQSDLDGAMAHYNAVLSLPGAAGTPAALIAQGRLQTLPKVAELLSNPVITPSRAPADGEDPQPGLDIDSLLRDQWSEDPSAGNPAEVEFDPDPLNTDP